MLLPSPTRGGDLLSRMQPSRRIEYYRVCLTTAKAPDMIMPRHGYTPKESIRFELVARVRRAIREGVYETPEKLELALRRLFQELGEDYDAFDHSLFEELRDRDDRPPRQRW